MKKVIIVGLMLMMFMGVVSASSVNGDFEGSPIVKVLNNGKVVLPDEVPAIIYKDRTMVPISLLKKMGATVVWDQDNYAVNVELPKAQSSTDLKGIKLILTQADNFTWTENTAEFMQLFINSLSSYFTGVNQNLSSRWSSLDLENMFSSVKSTTSNTVDTLNYFVRNNPNINNEKIIEQINYLSNCLVSLEKAKNNLLSWEKLRYSDQNLSQSNFDSYLSNYGKAGNDSNDVISKSHVEYLRLVNLILSF